MNEKQKKVADVLLDNIVSGDDLSPKFEEVAKVYCLFMDECRQQKETALKVLRDITVPKK